MITVINCNRGAGFISDSVEQLSATYQKACYKSVKVILAPVMSAIADTLTETISRSIQEGIRDASGALSPADLIGDFLFNWKK